MRSFPRILLLGLIALGSATAIGCARRTRTTVVVADRGPVVVVPKSGPPPHAPAHGYRRKHDGVDLVFEEPLGVYVVVGRPGLYYCDGSFYRQSGARWEISLSSRGPWKVAVVSKVPPRLVAHKKKKPGKGHKS